MSPNEQTIATFQERVREMILSFKRLKKENHELCEQLEQERNKVKELRMQLTQADDDFNALKMARMLEISDGDLESAKARMARMIREVNKCIAILSGEPTTLEGEEVTNAEGEPTNV